MNYWFVFAATARCSCLSIQLSRCATWLYSLHFTPSDKFLCGRSERGYGGEVGGTPSPTLSKGLRSEEREAKASNRSACVVCCAVSLFGPCAYERVCTMNI